MTTETVEQIDLSWVEFTDAQNEDICQRESLGCQNVALWACTYEYPCPCHGTVLRYCEEHTQYAIGVASEGRTFRCSWSGTTNGRLISVRPLRS